MLVPNHRLPSEDELETHLSTLEVQRSVIRDRVRGVRRGTHAGLFLFGPSGTGKTHTVLEACREMQTPKVKHYRGHITPIGLFELIADNLDATLVLDDVHAVLEQPVAVQMLLSALGEPDSDGARRVEYKKAETHLIAPFRGGVIAISNLSLRHGPKKLQPTHEALRSRVHTLEFAPSQDEILAMMWALARNGWIGKRENVALSRAQCLEALEYLFSKCTQSNVRLDLRVLVEKVFPDYWLWLQGDTDNHWMGLVDACLKECSRSDTDLTQAEKIERECELVIEICRDHESSAERIAAWKLATKCEEHPRGKSERAFFRRKAMVEGNGQ